MSDNRFTYEQHAFKDALENQLMLSGLDIKEINLSKNHEKEALLLGTLQFSKEQVDFELNQLYADYHTKKGAIDDFVFYLTDWKKNGEKIRKVADKIFEQNEIKANFTLRSFGGFSYNASSKTIFSCPKVIMSERSRFIKDEYVNDYIASCLLHETGHHMQSSETTLIEDRLTLLRNLEKEEISKSDFYYRYIDVTLAIEIDAWSRSERLVPPIQLNEEFYNKLKAHSLSTYRENLEVEADIFYELFSPNFNQQDMVIS